MNAKAIFVILFVAIATMFSSALAQSSSSNFTVSLSGLSSSSSIKTLDMVYVEGGTFTMGCSTGDTQCTTDEANASGVKLSDYYISKYQITNAQWRAVMGDNTTSNNNPKTSINWYDAVKFTCKLSELTGKKYRLATEAEFEFAARGGTKSGNYLYSGGSNVDNVAWHSGNSGNSVKGVGTKNANELGIYDMSGNVYEWVYDNWGDNTSGLSNSTDYTTPHSHMQKVRRGGSYDQPASESRVSGRKIRSIEGKDGSIGLRLALSVANTRPPNMADPCDLHQPVPTGGKKGFRDDRLITADDEVWNGNYGNGFLVVKENGATMATIYNGYTYSQTQGEWYTLNNFSLNIVPTSGSTKKYIYYLIDNDNMTLMEDGGMPTRWERKKKSGVSGASNVTAPTITSPKTPEELAPANYSIDMASPPTTGRDSRLIEGTSYAWWQNNATYGGSHNYRFDFDTQDSSRFVVYDAGAGTSVPLAAGKWFTVDNTFLRISDKNGCNYDYLYSLSSDGNTYYHISYQEYEPGDSRTFVKTATKDVTGWFEPTFSYTIDQGCSIYIPPSDDNSSPSPSSSSNLVSSSSSANLVPSSSSSNLVSSSSSLSWSSSSSANIASSSSSSNIVVSSSSNRSSSSSLTGGSSSSSLNGDSSSSENGETSILSQIATINNVAQIKNGINLQAMNGATVEIYGIRGNLISMQNYASGTYSISLANLQKGMYIVKVQFGGSNAKILQVPVM